MIPHAVIFAGPVISFGLGWWARGYWDKDQELRHRGVYEPRRVNRLAPPVSRDVAKEWAALMRAVEEEREGK